MLDCTHSMPTDTRIAGIALRHFLLSLAVAWPVLWFWSSELSRQAWTWGVLLAVPSILVSAVVVVWSIFAFVVWKDAGMSAFASAVAIAAGAGAVGGWFLLALAALFLVPWVGDVHVGIGGPNPLGLLGTLVGGLAITWFCARVISWHFERAPTFGLIACLLSAAAVPCLGVSSYHARQDAEVERIHFAAEFCEEGNLEIDDHFKEIRHERCFELAERTRNGVGGPKDLARAVDIYAWGCKVFENSSCAALAVLYENGEGVAKDLKKAYQLYERSCGVPATAGCVQLGRMVREGRGVKRNPHRAEAIWGEACPSVPGACTEMGRVYESGQDVEESTAQAATLFNLACRAGDADGCAHLARVRSR